MFDIKTVTKKIGELEVRLETGKIAKQANGAVIIYYGDNAILVTACMSPEAPEGIDFFPLTVNFQEKFYAAGKIPGGYLKREGKPSDMATLISRQIDRPIRPLFPKDLKNEVQVIASVMSADMVYNTEFMGIIGASAALAISDIPVTGYTSGVKIIYKEGKGYTINPSIKDIEEADLNLLVAGSKEGICMVEGGAKEVSDEVVLGALERAQAAILEGISLIEEFVELVKPEKIDVPVIEEKLSEEFKNQIREYGSQMVLDASNDKTKKRRGANLKIAFQDILDHFEIDPEHELYKEVKAFLVDLEVELLRNQIIEKGIRPDGRTTTEVRPITVELDLFKGQHGSALFTRGQTQSLGITTLGTTRDVQYIDSLEHRESEIKRFMLHYNFPPFSVGEVKRLGTLSRREIGHGHLAQRAIESLLPNEDEFPYVIRFVSEITESNGSSSMATVCSASLSLMAAGVPLKRAVAGIAMGLIWDKEKGKYRILTDIQGIEDHYGDMDFKMTGTCKGVTAFQMDIKTTGLPFKIMAEAITQAKEGRDHILSIMNNEISEPRSGVSENAPKLGTCDIPTDKISIVIGSGGKTIKKIMELTGSEINIADSGKCSISSKTYEGLEEAKKIVKYLTVGPEVNEKLPGKITRVEKYGYFIELAPGVSGLLHISKIKDENRDLKEGDKIDIVYEGKDDKGRIVLNAQNNL